MIKKFFILVLLLVLAAPWKANAQAPTTLESVEVDLWPEYDQPSMLVIYNLNLPTSAPLPGPMSVRIPATAAKPNAVAARQANGDLTNIPYEQRQEGEWLVLDFQAPTPEVRVEYYDPSLERQGSARHYEYHWPGDYAVDNFNIQVQQPIEATDLRTSPSLGAGVLASDGLTYFNAAQGALPAGQEFTLKIDYQKSSEALSVSTLPIEPSAPISSTTSGRMSFTDALPWILGGLGLLFIVGGGVWYWQSGRDKGQASVRKRRRKPSGERAASSTERGAPPSPGTGAAGSAPAEGHIYCHQCGKRAAPGDRFCRTCGTQLRTG